MKPNLRLFKIFLILMAFLVGSFTYAQQKSMTEKEKLAKELLVKNGTDLSKDVSFVGISQINYNNFFSNFDFSRRGDRGMLYDNGPFVTNPGAGVGGSDVSLLEPPNTTYGPSFNFAGGYRVADDVVVTADWNIDSLVVYGYQTGSTTTSTFTGLYLQIWNGDPSLPTSSVVWGDMTTNRLAATYWTHCYRALDFTGTTRPIMALRAATAGLNLPAGTYWLDYGATGTGASGPWAPPITILGQITTGNAKQFLTTLVWQNIVDAGSGGAKGMPFLIYGTGGVPPVTSPPRNLAAAVNGQDVHLTWLPPQTGPTPDQWIKWDDGVNADAIGTGAAADFDVASRWPVGDINAFNGMYLNKVSFFPNEAAASYTIKVWTGANASTLVLSQVVAAPVIGAFNEIVLTTPILIDGTQELWFGYNVNTTTGYPAGCDAGPQVAGKGNMIYWSGVWAELTALNPALVYNWNIAGYVSATADGPVSPMTAIPQPAINNPSASLLTSVPTAGLKFQPSVTDAPRALLGYNVYRDGTMLNGSVITDLFYDDNALAPGTYSYTATAVYDEGESVPAGPVVVTIGYCAVSATTCDEYIGNVTIGLINNTTDCTGGGYADYSSISTTLTPGTPEAITIQNPVPYTSDQCGIWIDWNNNFDFTDDPAITVSGTPGGGPYSAMIDVPGGTQPGAKRMRIRVMYTGTLSPCGNTSYGETEDYTVIVGGGAGPIYATDFEAFTAGQKVACQDPINWTTWSLAPCGAEDADVSTDFAHSGVNSAKDSGTNDLVLLMGDKTAGKFQLEFYLYIPAGYGGYYNVLQSFTGAVYKWGLEFVFADAGTATLTAGGVPTAIPYNHNQWYKVTNIIDLDSDLAEVKIDDVSVYTWQWSLGATGSGGINQLAAADFYSGAGAPGIVNPLYYFDDIEYKDIAGPVVLNPPTNLAASVTGQNVHLTWDAPVRGFLGYNVYRDGTLLNPALITDLFYDDNGLAFGTYVYTVTAMYDEGESNPAGPVTVTIINPNIVLMQNGQVSTCNASFYDTGGPDGQYQNNEDLTLTFMPSTPGSKMKFNFTAFECEVNYDYLKVYDGPDVSAPLIGDFNGLTVPPELVELIASESNVTGAITFHFTSDGSVVKNGWAAGVSCVGGGPASIYATDFETFTAGGQVACQDPINWTTWSYAPCSATEDAYVSTEFAHSPVNSVVVEGANDLVLLMGNKTTGKYEFTFDMYMPTGFCGYYNVLQDFAGGSSTWGLEVYFHTDGTGFINAGGNNAAFFNYNHDQWLPIKNVIDLDTDMAELFIDGVSIYSWQWSLGATGVGGMLQLGAADFFAGADANYPTDVPKYFFDDVDYKPAAPPANPYIVVSPASFSVELQPNTTTTQTMTIGNNGGATLDFSIAISYPVKSVKIINNAPMYERVVNKIPMKGGQVMLEQNGSRLIESSFEPNTYTVNSMSSPKDTWLSATPLTGSVPAGGTTTIQVTFDAAGLGVGLYNGLLSISSNDPIHPVKEVPALLEVKIPGQMPLVEDWSTGTFETNDWTFDPDQSNWVINSSYGNPAPSAAFNWSPSIQNYSKSLVSPMLDATAISDNVTLKYDLELNNYSTSTLEGMAVEVFDGTTWQLVMDYPNTNGSFSWVSEAINITALAAGHNFSVRFRAYGEDSFNINYWYVDNIKIYQQVVGNLSGTITKLAGGTPVEGALITINNALSGTYTATSGANGVYTITGAEAGAYALTVEKDGFNVIDDNITVIGNQTVTEDYALTAPILTVDPTSLTVTVPVGETTTRTVILTNSGNGPVDWTGAVHSTTGPTVFYQTDFESFTAGTKVACQDPVNWTTWSNAPCGAEDGMVSTDYAFSPVNSVKIDGSNDLVLPMGNKTSGKYEFSFEMFIPSGHGGYYNILHNFAGGSSEWGLEFYFEDAGTGQLHAGGMVIPYPYTHDTWFTVTNIIDCDNDMAEVLIDGTSVYSWQWSLDPSTGNPGMNQLGATDFYSGAGATGIVNPLYYFDNLVYKTADAKQLVSIPPSDGNFPRNDVPTSYLRAPYANQVAPTVTLGDALRGSNAYAFDIYPGNNFFSFDTDAPGSPTVIAPITIAPFGGTFDAVNTDFMWIIDYNDGFTKKVDVATGNVTPVGYAGMTSGHTPTGLTCDKTTGILYGSSTSGSTSTIYTIDPATGAATIVGNTNDPLLIDICVDGTGQMYGYDIGDDMAYLIDKATGASTVIGSIGFDANYAQGMGWDPVSDNIYLAAYSTSGEFRVMDKATGNTTFIGAFAGETDALGFPGGGGGNWASIEPTSGTIPVGGSQEVVVTFDGSYVPPQKDLTLTGVLVFSTDPDVGSPEVALSMTITGPFFGVLEGTVSHGGSPVEGVTVTATRQESPVYTYTAVTGADGTYSFPTTLYGTYDFTAEKTGFCPFESTGVIVVGDQTTVYDIAMFAPIMGINPLSITETVTFGTIITREITVSNTGDCTLEWTAAVATTSKDRVSIPASDGKFPRGASAPSFGAAPAGTSAASTPLGQIRGSLGYAFHVFQNQDFFSFDSDDPNALTVIASGMTETAMGGSFDAVNADFYYIWDYNDGNLKKVDIATGAFTTIGPCTPNGSQVMSGIACDKANNIMYGIGTDVSNTDLYTINMETGQTTTVGSTGIAGGIDCAIDADGAMWVFDIVSDEIYKVDIATGSSIDIGSAGFDGNYGQGMAYDYGTDNVYLAAFNNGSFAAEWRVLDRATGNTTLIADMGGVQVDGVGFPGGGTPPWLTIDKKTGILPAGASEIVTVTLDGSIPPESKDFTRTGTITFNSDPNVGTVVVPVSLTVTGPTHGSLEGVVTHQGVGVPNVTVTATKQGHAPYTATTDGTGHYLIAQILGGTYNVTATADGYHPFSTTGVVIVPPAATILDIVLYRPNMAVVPGSLSVNIPAGTVTDRILSVQNSGDGTLTWNAVVHANAKQAIHVPASNGVFPRNAEHTSFGRAPVTNQPGETGTLTELLRGTTGYAFDIYPGNTFFSFDTDSPGSPTIISPITIAPFGGTFDAVNTDFVWIIDYNDGYTKKVDVATGNVTSVGPAGMTGGHTPTGLTCDKTTNTLYGSSTDGGTSTIYTIDQTTGAATIVGNTSDPLLIDICVDGTGQMYGYDIGDDMSYLIDKTNGASTVIGSIGFDANYAQGMGWDPVSDNIYFAAYSSFGELRVFDRTTGATASIGAFSGETDGLSFPGGGSPQWLTMTPKTGIIPAGSSQDATVTFDATELVDGTYTGTITFTSDPNVGTVVVPVTLTVGGGPTVPTLTIPKVFNIVAGPVSVPVFASAIENMGSFQFTVDYDVTYLTYDGTSNWYPGITDVLIGTPAAGKLTFVWAASTSGITITNGTFFNLDFTYSGSQLEANIAWSDSPTPREFGDYNGNIFVPTYLNGFVTGHDVGVGVPETGAQAIKVFPNPASDIVNVKSDFTIKSIEVLSFIGQTVYTKSNLDTKLVQINVSSMASGVYFVKMDTDQGIKTTKITVRH